ncbi:hypothetical protein [Streptomyces sp. NBC_00467]|uniref:hypothetical protein n=1 Tax=Streptomyces sp. NBC_00467 TaxID=2975752 RepID=UPI002E19EE64
MTPMAEQWPAASEASAARTVFGPLGGIVELGAVAASESTSLSEISVGDFVADHREELDHFLAMVRELGDFDAETMDIVDDLGRLRPHEITAPSLLLWSGGIEPVSPDLGEPAAVRRMVNMGVDLQLAHVTHGLVGVAAARGGRAAVEANTVLVLECLRISAGLAGLATERAVEDVFRMWRVGFLPEVLMPSSSSPEGMREGFRVYAHALERTMSQPWGRR